ncbi:unnamed protein product [Leptosia nina]|uniref:Uncharacterized protein n=1 Tax=Leptosia nina TaxID=320188 RepID=A0AAV1JYQ7_9NEOP
MELKSSVVKSKSSNGGVSKKEKQKTRSDADFQPLNMKKRGVYVENKDDKLLNICENNDAEKKKPPPRPRPGQKKFLTSVLNILSKSTTGTQYPDSDEMKARRKSNKNTQRKRHNQETETGKQTDDEEYEQKRPNKPKYRSKILNGDNYVTCNDKLVILQSKKEIVHTPSNFSESKSFTISELNNPMKEILANNIDSGVAEGLAKQILDGRTERVKEDPSTLVADTRDDKKIYNFFVDLIETTFDVYNVETEGTNKDSEAILEIEETVAKKLNFKQDTTNNEEAELNFNIQEEKSPSIAETVYDRPLKSKKKVKQHSLKTQSFIYPKPKYIQKSSSVVIKRKPQTKKSKKKDLLDTIKEELKMDFMTFEEPQNLFEALRNMAKYKRRCQKRRVIHFENENETNFSKDCLNGRGIFPTKKSKKRKNRIDRLKEFKESDIKPVRTLKEPVVINVSDHSLKVFGYEYHEKDPFDSVRKSFVSSTNFTVDEFDEAFGISESSLDIEGFYSLLRE